MAHTYVSSSNSNTNSVPQIKAWLVCLSAALFFFYEFIQMNFFDALSPDLMKAFSANAGHLGYLSAFYFYANLIFLFPAGLILDRFSTRKIILIAMSICVSGTALFSLSQTFWQASIFRFLTGIGSAFCFLSCIRLASRWFPSHKMALISGLVVTMAMAGGALAHTPMTLLSEHFGWRHAVMFDAALGIVLIFIIACIVQDYPNLLSLHHEKQEASAISELGFWHSMRLSYFNWQNWLCGFYTCLMNSPIAIFGALWGTLYIQQTQHFSATQASTISGMIFIGTIMGSPTAGFLSDYFKRRKRFMWIGALLALLDMLAILYYPNPSFVLSLGLFFLLGFVTSTQIISYPTVSESNSELITASSVSVVSFCAISGYAIFQPLFGYLMDLKWNHQMINGEPIYQASDFSYAILLLPAIFVLAFLFSLCIRETYAKQIKQG